jgi:hypothetical protein
LSSEISMWSLSFSPLCPPTGRAQFLTSTVWCSTSSLRSMTFRTTLTTKELRLKRCKKSVSSNVGRCLKIRGTHPGLPPNLMARPILTS